MDSKTSTSTQPSSPHACCGGQVTADKTTSPVAPKPEGISTLAHEPEATVSSAAKHSVPLKAAASCCRAK